MRRRAEGRGDEVSIEGGCGGDDDEGRASTGEADALIAVKCRGSECVSDLKRS